MDLWQVCAISLIVTFVVVVFFLFKWFEVFINELFILIIVFSKILSVQNILLMLLFRVELPKFLHHHPFLFSMYIGSFFLGIILIIIPRKGQYKFLNFAVAGFILDGVSYFVFDFFPTKMFFLIVVCELIALSFLYIGGLKLLKRMVLGSQSEV